LVGDVGEEGLGDLRGMKQLSPKGIQGPDQIFLLARRAGTTRIGNCGSASKRYRVHLQRSRRPSYNAFGFVNPWWRCRRPWVELYKVQTPARPKATYSASVVGGGTR